MEFLSSYLACFGRIARGTWLFRLTALAVTCTAFGMLAQEIVEGAGAALFAAIFLWCAGAVSTQRLHDIGRSGRSLFVLLIPVLGPAWLLLQLFKRGAAGRNRYGRDPLSRMDYLQVDITK